MQHSFKNVEETDNKSFHNYAVICYYFVQIKEFCLFFTLLSFTFTLIILPFWYMDVKACLVHSKRKNVDGGKNSFFEENI
jgi:hypothetical protein